MNITKAKKEALAYIEPTLRYCFTDCCDSMRESEKQEERFNAVTDDKFKIDTFIEHNLLKEYADAWATIGYECDMTEEEAAHPSVCSLPIPFEKFKHLLDGTK